MSAGRRISPALQSMTSRLSEGEGCKVVMVEVVEAVLREAAGVSPSARDSSSEDETQMASSRRESSSSKRHMHKTNARKLVGRTGCPLSLSLT
jgi:hypothetical protein